MLELLVYYLITYIITRKYEIPLLFLYSYTFAIFFVTKAISIVLENAFQCLEIIRRYQIKLA